MRPSVIMCVALAFTSISSAEVELRGEPEPLRDHLLQTERRPRITVIGEAETEVKANRAIVTPQAKKKVSATAIWSAVKKAGFPPTKLVNSDGTYLPHPKTGAPQLTPNKSSGGEKTAGRSAGQPK